MRILGVGLGRTGSTSLKCALEALGAGPTLHMFEVLADPTVAEPFCRRLAGERVDWRTALAGWGSTLEWPAAIWWRELIEAWPEAPVLLHVRDEDAWYESCLATIHPANAPGGPVESMPRQVRRCILGSVWTETFGGWEAFLDRDHAIACYREHNVAVQAAVPADRLVVYRVGDGWEPLCRALGVPVPDQPFPRLNDTPSFQRMLAAGAH